MSEKEKIPFPSKSFSFFGKREKYLFPKRAKNALYNAIRIRICGVSTLKNITRGYTVA